MTAFRYPVDVGQPRQQRQAVHDRHVDIAHDDIEGGILLQFDQRLLAVLRKDELELAVADSFAESLPYQKFEIGFVVDDQNFEGHRHCTSGVPGIFRNDNSKLGIFAGLGIDANLPFVFLHDDVITHR